MVARTGHRPDEGPLSAASRPFEPRAVGEIAVKVTNRYDAGVLKVYAVQAAAEPPARIQ